MLALKQIRWNRFFPALIVCLLLPLSALALELRADSVTPFAENTITVITQNEGIVLKNVTRIDAKAPKIYAALSGDQCAMTGIKISRECIKGPHSFRASSPLCW